MKLDTDDAEFAATAARWLAHVEPEVIVDFDRVLALSPGYYPSTLHDLWLAELRRRGVEPKPGPLTTARLVELPVGHPLDYDWRFTADCRHLLMAAVRDATKPGAEIIYFGTPTLFSDAVAALPDRRHLLVDSNSAMVRALQNQLGPTAALRIRLGEERLPDEAAADVLVLDPPWYPADTLQFLSEAARVARPSGRVLLSQPTSATRPGVARERAELAAASGTFGLKLIDTQGGRLRYVTPHFERMSLGESKPGIEIPDDWRRGDLLTYEKTGSPDFPQTARPAVAPELWREVSFGPVRIKLRAAGSDDLGLIAPGLSRLETVSRRDPLRSEVGLWTSGNRVRTLVNVTAVARLIELCEDDLAQTGFTHENMLNHSEVVGLQPRVANALFDLLLLEYQEHTAGGYGVLR